MAMCEKHAPHGRAGGSDAKRQACIAVHDAAVDYMKREGEFVALLAIYEREGPSVADDWNGRAGAVVYDEDGGHVIGFTSKSRSTDKTAIHMYRAEMPGTTISNVSIKTDLFMFSADYGGVVPMDEQALRTRYMAAAGAGGRMWSAALRYAVSLHPSEMAEESERMVAPIIAGGGRRKAKHATWETVRPGNLLYVQDRRDCVGMVLAASRAYVSVVDIRDVAAPFIHVPYDEGGVAVLPSRRIARLPHLAPPCDQLDQEERVPLDVDVCGDDERAERLVRVFCVCVGVRATLGMMLPTTWSALVPERYFATQAGTRPESAYAKLAKTTVAVATLMMAMDSVGRDSGDAEKQAKRLERITAELDHRRSGHAPRRYEDLDARALEALRATCVKNVEYADVLSRVYERLFLKCRGVFGAYAHAFDRAILSNMTEHYFSACADMRRKYGGRNGALSMPYGMHSTADGVFSSQIRWADEVAYRKIGHPYAGPGASYRLSAGIAVSVGELPPRRRGGH